MLFALLTLDLEGGELWAQDLSLLQQDNVCVLHRVRNVLVRVILQPVYDLHDLEVALLIGLDEGLYVDERLCELDSHLDDAVVGHGNKIVIEGLQEVVFGEHACARAAESHKRASYLERARLP